MLNLLAKILPATGFYCVATPRDTKGFYHRFCQSVDEVVAVINAFEAEGRTVYVAQASFTTIENRKAVNAHRVKSYWFDIDCGPEKYSKDPDHSYPSQQEGIQALRTFYEVVGLPIPTVVNSGNGLYAHWCLTEEILPDQWKEVAKILKQLCEVHGFKADPSRTADISSVLRPVGSFNKKNGACKPVTCVVNRPATPFTEFANILRTAAKAHKIDVSALSPPKPSDLNSEFDLGLEGPPSSAVKVAEHCTQLAYFRDRRGNISEPLWYAGIGVLRHCEEGDNLIHEWSSGHPDYSPADTQAKIDQHKMPPTTCHHFGDVNAPGCVGCKWNGKIKTPIVLGRALQEVDVQQDDPDRVELPAGYVLTPQGLVYTEENFRFYAYDIYPIQQAVDMSLGFRTVTLKHKLPFVGWQEFTIQESLVNDPKKFFTIIHDNGVSVPGTQEKKYMMDYLTRYMEKLKATTRANRLQCQMGWKQNEDGSGLSFILGTKMMRRGEQPIDIGLARNVPEVVKAFTSKGDLGTWIHSTGYYNTPELYPHAFAFCAGSFGAPLMQFTGFDGGIISCVGESGVGKTLTARFAQSTYGDHSRLIMLNEDTKNSLISRLGVYGSLPLTVDEVSNIDPMELSALVYRITQGRDKARLSRSAVEKQVLNQWKTIALVSSNHSLIDKLGAAKSDSSAELNRVFELEIPKSFALNREVGTYIYRVISENYGLAGELYIQYLVDHQDMHVANLDRICKLLEEKTNAPSDERYLTAIAAAAIYGGVIAYKLGLIRFRVEPLIDWVAGAIREMRLHKKDQVVDSIGILGQFFDRYANNVLATENSHMKNGAHVIREPKGELVIRYELDTQRCFISKEALKKFIQKSFGSYTKLRRELELTQPTPALVRSDLRKVLGSNCANYGGSAQYVWELDMRSPALGNIIPTLSLSAEANKNFEPGKVVQLRR